MRDMLRSNEDRYAEFVKPGGGHVVIRECGICGHLRWGWTRSSEPDGYSIEREDYCSCCEEIRQRSPEIFAWVVSVAATILRESASDKGTPAL